MARNNNSNSDGFIKVEYLNEVSKVRNLHATNRRIRSQEKRDKAETTAFAIAHKDFIQTRSNTQREDTKRKREQYQREREIRRSRAKRM
jgi:hypothetical protein